MMSLKHRAAFLFFFYMPLLQQISTDQITLLLLSFGRTGDKIVIIIQDGTLKMTVIQSFAKAIKIPSIKKIINM